MSKFDAINDSLDIEVVEEEETKVTENKSKSVEKTKKDSTLSLIHISEPTRPY